MMINVKIQACMPSFGEQISIKTHKEMINGRHLNYNSSVLIHCTLLKNILLSIEKDQDRSYEMKQHDIINEYAYSICYLTKTK